MNPRINFARVFENLIGRATVNLEAVRFVGKWYPSPAGPFLQVTLLVTSLDSDNRVVTSRTNLSAEEARFVLGAMNQAAMTEDPRVEMTTAFSLVVKTRGALNTTGVVDPVNRFATTCWAQIAADLQEICEAGAAPLPTLDF